MDIAETTQRLKKLRSSKAGSLTRLQNTALKGVNDGQSKRYLRECAENITQALGNLADTNDLYCAQLSEDALVDAGQWFGQRREAANRILVALERLIQGNTVPSVSETSSMWSSNHSNFTMGENDMVKLQWDAEQAELDLQQAKRQARILQKEAALEMEKSHLQATNLVEKAELTARKKRELADNTSVQESLSSSEDSLYAASIPKRVENWLRDTNYEDTGIQPPQTLAVNRGNTGDISENAEVGWIQTAPKSVKGEVQERHAHKFTSQGNSAVATGWENQASANSAEVLDQFCPLRKQSDRPETMTGKSGASECQSKLHELSCTSSHMPTGYGPLGVAENCTRLYPSTCSESDREVSQLKKKLESTQVNTVGVAASVNP